MANSVGHLNIQYWQNYKPGEIPTFPASPPDKLLSCVDGPILDVGTGDGVLAEKLASKGFRVYGIDIAVNIVSENKKRKSKVEYSIRDITTKTDFADNFFDLVIFKFVLTNIHKKLWKGLGNEIFRILKPQGKIWLLEPLVSESYAKRYQLAANFVKDKNCAYVFFDKKLAEKINTKNELERAIKENKVSRIVKHYTIEELKQIFNKLELTDRRIFKATSPSGFTLNTIEGIFLKDIS